MLDTGCWMLDPRCWVPALQTTFRKIKRAVKCSIQYLIRSTLSLIPSVFNCGLQHTEKGRPPELHWKKIALVDLLLTALLILSTRFATFLHEFFGHAFVAFVMGGQVHRVQISLFGGGKVFADPGTHQVPSLFLFCLAGIFINLITGALPMFTSERIRKLSPTWALFWAAFVLTSVLGALAYFVLGLYYNFGDPVNWIDVTPRWLGLFWVPLLMAMPFAAYFVSRFYISIQEILFPTEGFLQRFKILLLTLGVSSLAYASLFVWTNQSLASINSAVFAYERAEARVIEKKKKELAQQIHVIHPELSQEDVQAQVERSVIHVEPGEVPTRFPMLPVIAILYLFGWLTALRREYLNKEASPVKPRAPAVLLVCLAAALLIVALACTNGVVYDTKKKKTPPSTYIVPGYIHLKVTSYPLQKILRSQ